MKENKKFDLLVVFIILAVAVLVSLFCNLKPIIVFLLYLLTPSIYLILREKKNFKKIFWAVIIFGVIFGLGFDFIVTFNEGWIVTRLIFPAKIFGFYPIIDDILGFMLMTLFMVVFYEHFLDDEKNRRISRNLKLALIVSLIVLVFIFVIYLINPALLKIPYVYLVCGLVAIAFPIVINLHRPRFLGKFFKLAAFFFVVWFVLELVCLKNSGWIFPGQYIGTVEIFGLKFPFEELFFWMMWYAAAVASYYEVIVDDQK